ncbi:MAG: type I-PGING CRISPR-associated protein Cas5p [Melioribacteraceae bacterium]|nr:type I-PGING CRISPR-associated protein Cas5p [Melioribacteraceae bacterium]
MKIDIEFLFEPPEFTKNAILTIKPLTPLSMVSSIPGSYYKTERVPDKFMLCGLFENILSLHLDENERNMIRKKIKKHYKKQYKLEYTAESSNVGYKPILDHLFEIVPPIVIPDMKFYDDLWTQHLIGSDSRHLNGSFNNDWNIEKDLIKLKESEKNEFFTNNRSSFPQYYRSPQIREFIITDGEFLLNIKITQSLFNIINDACVKSNIGYLGTSEGWVDISIGEAI